MKESVVRSVVLVGLIVGILATFRLSNRMHPRISCSKEVQEGRTFYCSADLEYPPDKPYYVWTVDEGCSPVPYARLVGQTIQLQTPAPSLSHTCQVRVIVYDSQANRHLVGTKDLLIPIGKSTDSPAPVTTLSSASPVPLPAPGVKKEPAAKLEKNITWPDWTEHALADDAPVQGRATGADLSSYKVAVYTLMGGGWYLQGVAVIDATTGKWTVIARFGSAYAALLVKNSFDPESSVKTLPSKSQDIVDLKRTD